MTEKKEPTQKITFKRDNGRLVRMVEIEVPFILGQGEEPLAQSKDSAYQVFTKDGEKRYRKFLDDTVEDYEKKIKSGKEQYQQLIHLKHDELTDKSIDTFKEAIKVIKTDPRKAKFHTENMEKLCGIIWKKIKLRFELAELKKRLEIAKAEKAELDKIR